MACARTDETARRLATILGIGLITASLIAATVGDISLFKTARQFAAWLGLRRGRTPPVARSRLGRITKTGNREIRKLLVLGGHVDGRPGRTGGTARPAPGSGTYLWSAVPVAGW